MKRFFTLIMLISISLAGCQKSHDNESSSSTANVQKPEMIMIKETGPVTTPSGAQFIVPRGWKKTDLSDGFEFKSPEGSLRVNYYELSAKEYHSASDAIQETFRRYSENLPFKLTGGFLKEYKNIQGYDVIAQKEYINLENMNIAVNAVRKHGDTWYCIILSGRQDAFYKRAKETQAMADTLKRADEIAHKQKDAQFIATHKPRQFDAEASAALDQLIQKQMDVLGVPGLSVAVVQDGKVVHAKGYGTRIYGQDLPVTEKTLFLLGSTSKIFTGYLVAEAVKQGKVNWDTPIYQLLPEFVIGTPKYREQITLKHLMSMTSGLPRRDFLWPFRDDNAAEVLAEMAHIPSILPPGARFIYNNHGVSSAGYAVARSLIPEGTLDEAWKKAMQTYVLDPLGMTSSTYDYDKVQTLEYAAPTAQDYFYNHISTPMSVNKHIQGYAPAGALWSNAEDLGRFMISELANHDPVHAKRWEPVVTLEGDDMTYGIGMFLDIVNGIKIRKHSGNVTGSSAIIILCPEQNFGIAVMESDGNGIISNFFEKLILDFIYKNPKDWTSQNKNFDQMLARIKQSFSTLSKADSNLELTPDIKWLESLAGKYHGKELENVEIAIVNGKGIMKTPYWETEIARSVENDKTWLILLQHPSPRTVKFEVISLDGKVVKLVMTEDQKIAKYEYVLNKL